MLKHGKSLKFTRFKIVYNDGYLGKLDDLDHFVDFFQHKKEGTRKKIKKTVEKRKIQKVEGAEEEDPIDFFLIKKKLDSPIRKYFKKKKYSCLVKSSLNNVFITVIDRFGNVILKDSKGKNNDYTLNSKKKKNSFYALRCLIRRVIFQSLLNRIIEFYSLSFHSFDRRWLKFFLREFKFSSLYFNSISYNVPRPHNDFLFFPRGKKLRRI